jgi:hypothetical protein
MPLLDHALAARFILRRKALDVQYEYEAQKIKAQEEERVALEAQKKAEDELAYKTSR